MEWINVILQGVLVGGLYAMFAAGLSLIFGVMRLVNLAHGDLIVLAAFVILVVAEKLGLDPFHQVLARLFPLPHDSGGGGTGGLQPPFRTRTPTRSVGYGVCAVEGASALTSALPRNAPSTMLRTVPLPASRGRMLPLPLHPLTPPK